MNSKSVAVSGACAALLSVVTACGPSPGPPLNKVGAGTSVPLVRRAGTVVSDGCALDTFQLSTLASPSAQLVIQDVVLLCFVPRANGDIGPSDASARAQLAALVDGLHMQGYRVRIGVSFTDETGERFDGAQTAVFLNDPKWRASVVTHLQAAVGNADGLELDFQKVSSFARPDVTSLVASLAAVVRPKKELGLMAPPSVQDPSDVIGGDAIDVASLAQYIDRMHVMTLDFSSTPGPTIDSGWAVDAVRFARNLVGDKLPLDVSMPLYGEDFSNLGHRDVTYLETRALLDLNQIQPIQGPTGAPHFQYTDENGLSHELWYDDAESTIITLNAWSPPVLPSDVGVLYYGLGAEDPTLWLRLGGGQP